MKQTTREKLKENINKYKTQKEAALDLGVSSTRISILAKKMKLTPLWRTHKGRTRVEYKYICENCHNEFIINGHWNPLGTHRFCSKKCQGQWLGRNYGFKRKE